MTQFDASQTSQSQGQADPGQFANAQAQGQAQQAATGNSQGAAQQQQDDGFVRVPVGNLESQGYGRDAYKALGHARQYREMEAAGFDQEFVDYCRTNQLSGRDIRELLDSMLTPAQQQAQGQGNSAQYPAQNAQQNQQAQAQAGQPQYVTLDEARKMLAQEFNQRDTKQAFQQSMAEEQQAIDKVLADVLGLKRSEADISRNGRTFKADPRVDLFVKPALREAVQSIVDDDLEAQGIRQGTPKFNQLRNHPATAEQVNRAASYIKPFLQQMGQSAVTATAQQMNQFPPATNGAGAGGRAQADFKDMTPDQQKSALISRARQNPAYIPAQPRK